MMTPGQYLRKRRLAARLSLDDVAAMVHTAPRLGEVDRVAWLRRVEDDIAALGADVVATLSDAFPFSRRVLQQLIDRRSYGAAIEAPRLCAHCACSDRDPCIDPHTGEACGWSGPDLCDRCAPSPGV